jgi:hypothetical protein
LGTVAAVGGLPLETLILIIITFPLLVLCYSFIVLPPTYLLREEIAKTRTEVRKGGLAKYLYGLLPLVGLLVYGIIVILLF